MCKLLSFKPEKVTLGNHSPIAFAVLAIVAVLFLPPSSTMARPGFKFNAWSKGRLTVYSTLDCKIVGAAFVDVNVEPPYTYGPWGIPEGEGINDVLAIFTNTVGTTVSWKAAAPDYKWEEQAWVLKPLNDWLEANLVKDTVLPVFIDSGQQPIYSVVNLNVWLADPRPLRETYSVVNGQCPDLPGFLIGTTPIIFNPNIGPGENPFQTTRLTGPVDRAGEMLFKKRGPAIPTVTQWGLIVLGGLFVASGAIVIVRRSRRVAP